MCKLFDMQDMVPMELWTWITQSGGGGQHGRRYPQFRFARLIYSLLQSSGLNPYNLNGAAPYYSGLPQNLMHLAIMKIGLLLP